MKKIKAKKSLGQNFLIDEEALTDIAGSIEIAGKNIIEVGPGYGALTSYILTHHPQTLDLVELDPDMIELLDGRFMGEDREPIIHENGESFIPTTPITIHHQDVLKFLPPYTDYSVIANIPYYITSPILFHFLYPKNIPNEGWGFGGDNGEKIIEWGEVSQNRVVTPDGFGTFATKSTEKWISQWNSWNPPEEMTIMMQEEVGEKIVAGRNKKPHHSFLSLAMELACEEIEIVRYVGRESFDPAPKVDSIVLKFSVKKNRDRAMEEKLLSLWKVAFTQPRKTLLSNLKGSTYDIESVKRWLNECGYDERVRAEAVKREDWGKFL